MCHKITSDSNKILSYVSIILKCKTASIEFKNIARILRLIANNQWVSLKSAFKKYNVDINLFLDPIFEAEFEKNPKELFLTEFFMSTFLQMAVWIGCSDNTIITLINLGSEITQPRYSLYRTHEEFVSNKIDLISLQDKIWCAFNFAVDLAVMTKNWKIVNIFLKKNKYSMLSCEMELSYAIDSKKTSYFKKTRYYEKKYPQMFKNYSFEKFYASIGEIDGPDYEARYRSRYCFDGECFEGESLEECDEEYI